MVFHLESGTLIGDPDFGAQHFLGKILIEGTNLEVARNDVLFFDDCLLWGALLIDPLEIWQQIHEMLTIRSMNICLYVMIKRVISNYQSREDLVCMNGVQEILNRWELVEGQVEKLQIRTS